MTWRGLAIALFLLVAALLQVGIATRLGLPGAAPDVLVVSVIAIALQRGGTVGAIVGISAGLLSDALPPGVPLFGVTAVVLGIIGGVTGWLANRERDRNQATALRLLFITVIAAVVSVVVNAVLVGLLSSERLVSENFFALLVWQGVYALILAGLIVPLYSWIDRISAPAPVTSRRG